MRPITAFVHAKTYEFLSVGPHPKEVRGFTICSGTPRLAKGKCKVES